MDVFTQISQLLHEGQDWEAQELFFKEAVPYFQNLHDAVNSLHKDPKPLPDMDMLWEKMRERLRKTNL